MGIADADPEDDADALEDLDEADGDLDFEDDDDEPYEDKEPIEARGRRPLWSIEHLDLREPRHEVD